MVNHKNGTLHGGQVLDGNNYDRCRFIDAQLMMRGEQPFAIADCQLERVEFGLGGAASVFMGQLITLERAFPHRPNFIDHLFAQIRPGATLGGFVGAVAAELKPKTVAEALSDLMAIAGTAGGAATVATYFKGDSKAQRQAADSLAEIVELLRSEAGAEDTPRKPVRKPAKQVGPKRPEHKPKR